MADTNFANQNNITTFSGATGAGAIADNTDHIHTGIVKVLEAYSRGNYVLDYGNLQQNDGGTYTIFKFDGNVKYFRDGVLTTATPAQVEMSAPHGTYDRYDLLVIASGGGLAIRAGGASATPTVAALTAGDVPVALIKVVSGAGNKPINRPLQLYGFDKSSNSLSIGYNSSGYTEMAKITAASGGTTIEVPTAGGDFTIDNTDADKKIVMRLGTDTSATAFEVRNNSDAPKFSVGGDGAVSLGNSVANFTVSDNITIGADADGADRTITFGHGTLKSIMGIDDSSDVFAINTDATFETSAADNDFYINTHGDVAVTNGQFSVGHTPTVKTIGTAINITNKTEAADMDGTGSGIFFNQYYNGGSAGDNDQSGLIGVGCETDWTNTASTRDSFMSFYTSTGGNLNERMKLSNAGNLQIDGDLTISGGNITNNLTLDGDLTLNNGATIVNTSGSLLTITEATTAFSAAVTAGSSVSATTTVTGTTGLETGGYHKVGSTSINVGADPAVLAATPAEYRIYYLHSCTGPLQLPDPSASAGRIISLKNVDPGNACVIIPTAGAIEGGVVIATGDRTVAPPPFLALTGANQLTLEPHMSITLHAVTDTGMGAGLTTGWYIIE
tara:strand:+ start:4012 stop:5856 length:1845 start_codon:yes stop_codon:yes gene_type:complete